ncbi:cobalamin biosynthesis protein CobW [Halobacteriales archaeon QS_5_70_15]|nr:MAG: cobalamin biosynthesis protein CobW [Halobacteriales archaeon QS_5_70_15]
MSLTGDDGIPVTVLSGALGAGKTTTLNHLLTNAGGRRLAVLVNDMGAVNVDAELVEARGDGITELSNGCICCDLRDDLEVEVSRLARRGDFDHLVVESSGISEPAPVARLFTTGPASAPYRLDTLATVVDASDFRSTLADGEVVTVEDIERTRPGQAESEGEVRPLSDLLVAQVECADVLLVNKCDAAGEAGIEATERLLEALNPDARRYRTTRGRVDPDVVLGTGLFDHDTVSQTESWKRAIEHAEAHKGDHGDGEGEGHADGDHGRAHDPQATYGVTSFPFRADRPLHPGRLASFLSDLPDSVIRSKGIVWVAGRDDVALRYSGVGPSYRAVTVRGNWIAALPEERRETQRRMRPDLPWDEEHGDRRTELVFIGRGMDEGSLRERLADCVLDDEIAADPSTFENPFPQEEGEELTFG